MFDSFHLSDPDVDGQCSTDFFLATGGSPVPQLCGLNTGQHRKYFRSYRVSHGKVGFDIFRIFNLKIHFAMRDPVVLLQFHKKLLNQLPTYLVIIRGHSTTTWKRRGGVL